MPTCGIGDEVAFVGSSNGEVEGRVLLADCFDEDYITIDARGG